MESAIFISVLEEKTAKGGGQRTVAVALGKAANIQNVKLPENTRKRVSLQELRKPTFSDGAGWTR